SLVYSVSRIRPHLRARLFPYTTLFRSDWSAAARARCENSVSIDTQCLGRPAEPVVGFVRIVPASACGSREENVMPGGNGRRVAIVAGCRTPFCKSGTALKDIRAVDLARYVARELLERTNLDGAEVNEVVFG